VGWGCRIRRISSWNNTHEVSYINKLPDLK
jgi:hypothetical protein